MGSAGLTVRNNQKNWARCCEAPFPSEERGEGSKGALADEALQLWDQAEALLEERVDGQCLAEGGERLARLVLLDVDEADAASEPKYLGSSASTRSQSASERSYSPMR
jgi:hypothetical protein